MSVEIFVERLRRAIDTEVKANHAQMDTGKAPDEYMQLVGRNKALTKLSTQTINECIKDLVQEDDD